MFFNLFVYGKGFFRSKIFIFVFVIEFYKIVRVILDVLRRLSLGRVGFWGLVFC